MDSENPKVSFVIPTFNRGGEITRSIYSVLAQTFHDLELIVVDDCSSDNTEALVKAIKDARIRYVRLEQNVGGAEARNVGSRLARGKYIAFQDSDDEWFCHKLEKSVKELESAPQVGALFTAFIQIWDTGCRKMPLWAGIPKTPNFFESLLWRNVVGTPTLVVRKSVLDEVGGFDRSMPRYQDWELGLRLACVTEIKYLDEPLLLSYVTAGSITHDQLAHSEALSRIYKKHRDSINLNRPLRAAWIHRLGDAKIKIGEPSGRRLLLKAWMIEPLNIRYFSKALLALPNSTAVYESASGLIKKMKCTR